jgi:hypothetical protein
LPFSFLFIWLNLWKSIVNHKKNHKIENPILLDFTWVDLHSKHIIWYVLVQSFCYEGFAFFFFIYLAEYLKNHSKSQKNHKIENLILLDFTWVDLHSEHIISYALVQQNNYRSCNYELLQLITKKHRSKATTKNLY